MGALNKIIQIIPIHGSKTKDVKTVKHSIMQ